MSSEKKNVYSTNDGILNNRCMLSYIVRLLFSMVVLFWIIRAAAITIQRALINDQVFCHSPPIWAITFVVFVVVAAFLRAKSVSVRNLTFIMVKYVRTMHNIHALLSPWCGLLEFVI